MSDIQSDDRTFLAHYGLVLVDSAQIGDFVETWHASGDEEPRSLNEYLGLTDEEGGVWFITPRALPAILAVRRAGGPLRAFIEPFYRQLRTAGTQEDRPARPGCRRRPCREVVKSALRRKPGFFRPERRDAAARKRGQ